MSALNNQLTLCRMFHKLTHDLLAGISDDDFRAIPFGGGNSPNWIIGHLAVGNMFALNLMGHPQSELETWMPVYGPGSTPSSDPAAVMGRGTLMSTFDRTLDEAIAAAGQVDEPFLLKHHDGPFLRNSLPTNGDLLGHLLTTHFAMHVGQLSAFRRLRGLGPVLDLNNS